MRVRGRLRVRVSAPLSGVPLPGRVNPYIAVPLGIAECWVEVERGRPEDSKVRGAPEPLILSAVNKLSEALDRRFRVSMELQFEPLCPRLSLYAASLLCMVKAVARFFGVDLGEDELVEYSSIIDGALGLSPEYRDLIHSLRLSMLGGRPLIYRRGETPIILKGKPPILKVRECVNVAGELGLLEPLMDAITHVSGFTTIHLNEAIERRDGKTIGILVRLENAIWYAVYGILPPKDPGLKVIPDIGGVCFASIRI